MRTILTYLTMNFRLEAAILFLISGIVLVFIDSKEYKKQEYMRDYKFAKYIGYFYMIGSVTLYTILRYVRI